jgi:hypothetical protein
MDPRFEVSGMLEEFGREMRPVADVTGLYVGGSLATGDYRAGVSDLDLVAIVQRPLSSRDRRRVGRTHRQFIAHYPAAKKLHCVYVPIGYVDDIAERHVTWAAQRLFRRPFSGVARAEVLRYGWAVFGPEPGTLIPAISDDELRRAVRRELAGYWTRALRWPWIWLRDFFIDLSVLTLVRAEATLVDGELITKRAALARLDRLGVPAALAEQIRRRRQGHRTRISLPARVRRARQVHRLVSESIRTLLSM